ncbi:hypothetical protein [Staphylococcus pseudoxylosus]
MTVKYGISVIIANILLKVPTENIPKREVIKKLIQNGCQNSERVDHP